MEYKKTTLKIVMLPVLLCFLLTGCAHVRAERVSYSEASCQVLMRSPAYAGCEGEGFGDVPEK